MKNMPRGIPRDPSVKRTILHRLKIVRGHLNKVIKMVGEGEYCVDVLHQSQAVQKALRGVDNLILENHLKTCTTDAVKKGREEVIDEMVEIFKKVG
ncbi:MAG TPA: hypothetical protein DDZ05_02460 [Candidatus Blackburnbacteria bacterium]|nr:hypothetical protein [Candidatus Blackburnbacteria bacterium]